jgi:hypothetical protein
LNGVYESGLAAIKAKLAKEAAGFVRAAGSHHRKWAASVAAHSFRADYTFLYLALFGLADVSDERRLSGKRK